MEKLQLNEALLEQIFNDSAATCELREFLNFVIDEELNSEDIDCDLIDECVDALEELSFESEYEKPHLTALLSEERFLKRLRKQSILNKSRYGKLAVICASAVLLVSVSSVKTSSGQTIAKSIARKIATVINFEYFETPKEDETEHSIFTDVPTETTQELTSETDTETEPTSERITTVVSLERIYTSSTKDVKTEYNLGESLELDGLRVIAVYSNGSENQIPLDECSVTVPKNFTKDPGKYKITVTYNEKSFSYYVTVVAVKESVILNSIYGTFSDDFNFKVASFDNLDFSGMTVTAVYSDGSEENIPLEECEIEVEKNFMELENKALVTVSYEERSFSFILTKEVVENEES